MQRRSKSLSHAVANTIFKANAHLVGESNLGLVRQAADTPAAFSVAFLSGEIKVLAGWKLNRFLRWETVSCGTAKIKPGRSVHHRKSPAVKYSEVGDS